MTSRVTSWAFWFLKPDGLPRIFGSNALMLRPHEGFLKNLRQEIHPDSRAYLSREDAYVQLRRATGQDFGYDADAWERWIMQNLEVFKKPLPRPNKPTHET